MKIDLGGLRQLAGFVGAAVVDSETGLVLGSTGGNRDGELEIASAGAMEMLRAARGMVQALERDDEVEDAFVAMSEQFLLARTLQRSPAIFLMLLLERRSANLGLARLALKQVEGAIVV